MISSFVSRLGRFWCQILFHAGFGVGWISHHPWHGNPCPRSCWEKHLHSFPAPGQFLHPIPAPLQPFTLLSPPGCCKPNSAQQDELRKGVFGFPEMLWRYYLTPSQKEKPLTHASCAWKEFLNPFSNCSLSLRRIKVSLNHLKTCLELEPTSFVS